MSIGIHLLLLAVLFFFVTRLSSTDTGEAVRSGAIVLAIRPDQQKTKYLDELDDEKSENVPVPTPEFPSQPPSAAEFGLKFEIDTAGAIPLDFKNDAGSMTANTTGMGALPPYELTDGDLELIEADQKLVRSRQPVGKATTISVFGTTGMTGRKFVFLIDRSKSMGDQGLGVLKRARSELDLAIGGLKTNHQFQVVVYHNSTATILKRQLLAATEANKNLVPGFLSNLVAFGGTNHKNGLYAALAFRPDVIVMMTDGGSPFLHKGQLEALTRAAGSTEIHTIQFGAGPRTESDHFLMALAEMNDGSYQYVDVRDWRNKNLPN